MRRVIFEPLFALGQQRIAIYSASIPSAKIGRLQTDTLFKRLTFDQASRM